MMTATPFNRSPNSVVVVGMHRSGTSLTARLLATLGVKMGTKFIAADRANSEGYFEDRELVRFHQKAFRETLQSSADGHADWGWTEGRYIESHEMAKWSRSASRLVSRRCASKQIWGFKDPRTTMVLDFWDQLLPNPVYVCVYRKPTLVADSMQRLQADVFLRYPDYAWSIWKVYNKRLLDFQRRHRDRCLLLNIESLVQHLESFPSLLHSRLGIPTASVNLNDHYQAKLMGTEHSGAYDERVSRAVWSECFQLYDELESESHLPSCQATMLASLPPRTGIPVNPPAVQPAFTEYTLKDLSIVIPTYNDAVLLVEAITSVERLTRGKAELLICDDGSTDPASLKVLDRLRKAGYRVQQQSNRGLSATRNRLISEARGKLILPLDADNRLCPDFIESAIAAFNQDPQLGVVYGDRRLFGLVERDLRVADFNLHRIAWRNYIDACAMFRRELWEDVGGYDETLWALEDWEFWIHAGKRGWRFQHLPRIAFEYRVRPNSLLARINTRSHYRQLNRLVVIKHFDLYSSVVPKVVRNLLGNHFAQADDRCRHGISNWMIWMSIAFLGIRYSLIRLRSP